MPPNVTPITAGSAEFRLVLAAEAMSNFGAMLSRLSIPWLAALVLQATPLQMGGLLVADVVADTFAFGWARTEADPALLALLLDPQWQPYLVFPEAFVPGGRVVTEVQASTSNGHST
eukprot:gene57475-76738_t